MKITANLEFDTFAEAEKVFRHLGMLGVKPASCGIEASAGDEKKPGQEPQKAAGPEAKPAEAKVAELPRTAPAADAGPTLDDVKTSFRDYVGKGGGRTAMTARAILSAHGIDSGRIGDARPEQFAVLKRAFDTAGPEHPLGEAT